MSQGVSKTENKESRKKNEQRTMNRNNCLQRETMTEEMKHN